MIEPRAFIEFAEGLYNNLEHEDDCIEVRNCISRAYYFVHHYGLIRFSRDKRASRFLSQGNTDRHRMLVEFFRDIRARDIAERLNSLRNKRNDADYELGLNLTKSDATTSLRDARNIEMRMNRITPQTSP